MYWDIDSNNHSSKRRKTTHVIEGDIVRNPLKVLDLNTGVDSIEKELNSKTHQFDFVMNSHKKRTFNKIDAEPKVFISNIPKPGRNINIYYSKYIEYPSNIPKV